MKSVGIPDKFFLPVLPKAEPKTTHTRALGGSKAVKPIKTHKDAMRAVTALATKLAGETSHKPRPRGLETAFVHELSVPDLVDVLIARARKTNGFTSLTFKQRANLMLAILER